LIELSFEPIFVWHPEKGIVDWNRGAEQLYGFTREEALGQNSHKLLRTIHPIEPADLHATLNTVRSWTGEVQHLTKDGRQVFVESAIRPLKRIGEILILETNHDITERKRAGSRNGGAWRRWPGLPMTHCLESRWRVTFEAWNPAAERLFGYTAAEAIGQHVHVLAASADHRDQRDFLARACAGEMIPPYYARRLRKDGTFVEVSVALGPVKASNARLSRFRLPCMISATGRSGRRANGL